MKGVKKLSRKTKQNKLTSPEEISKINPENISLMNDFLEYLHSVQRSEKTIYGYKNDLEIFFCWNLRSNGNKPFIEITKRNIISYQNWLIEENENSPARIRRLKSTLSSMSNYIENILDDEFKDFKSIIKKIENPINVAVREKTILTKENIQFLLDFLVDKKQYRKACVLALAAFSGRRKAELPRFKTNYFTDDNIVFGSLYKTPEKVKTKGRGKQGKLLHCYTLVKDFSPYLEYWLAERKEKNIVDEYLFVDETGNNLSVSTLNSWANTFSSILGLPFYWHSLRHYFTTLLYENAIPTEIIQQIIGWGTVDMCKTYIDSDFNDELGKYFDENGIKTVEQKNLTEL